MRRPRETITKIIYTTGKCTLVIRDHRDILENSCGQELLDDDDSGIDENIITPDVLKLISNAYYAGYCNAMDDARETLARIMIEKSRPCKPAAKISEVIDYRSKRRGAE